MAFTSYLKVHDVDLEAGNISCDVNEVLEICEGNNISLSDIVHSYFLYGATGFVPNDEEREALIIELQSMGRSTEIDLDTVKEWIREQWNISVLTDTLLTVTETLARRAEALSR